MSISCAVPDTAVALVGAPYERGRAQAQLFPEMAAAVAEAIEMRLDEACAFIGRPEIVGYIAALHDYAATHYPEILEEIRGIGEGFGIDPERIFTYLNCSHAADVAGGALLAPQDGCTSFAVGDPARGAVVAKNRDYRPEHIALQKVFRHSDPTWEGASFLCIGSLGSPGNFSSGMNSRGLAVTDTASRVNRHAIGMHRYFLLTWLLAHCGSVVEAVDAISGMPHAGSGLLVLGDRSGAVAAVELGPGRATGVEVKSQGAVGRANHFMLDETRGFNLDSPAARQANCHSERRFAALRDRLSCGSGAPDPGAAAALLARHAADGSGFCRHGGEEISTTIAAAVYATGTLAMFFAAGNPCSTAWRRYDFA